MVIIGENFNAFNATKILWATSKFMNRSLNSNYSIELSSSLLNRQEFSRIASVNHNLHRRVTSKILAQKKTTTASNIALTLYSCASINYYNKEFFEN